MAKNILKIEDYLADKTHEVYADKISKQAVKIRFDKKIDLEDAEDLSIFILKPKQAFYTNSIDILPYIDYFIEYFDDDDELLLAYFRIKFMIDRKCNYSKDLFLQELYENILTDTMVQKIENLVDYNYQISLSNKKKYNKRSIQITDEHGRILLCTAITMKIMIPLVTHYIDTMGIKNTDKFIYKSFKGIFRYFEGPNNMTNKMHEFVLKKLQKTKKKDRGHWQNVEIFGKDIASETDIVYCRLIVDIIYKFNFEGNVAAMVSKVIKRNIEWLLRTNFKKNRMQINDEKDADGLSDLDKIEMNNSKFDESYIIMGSINIKQNIKRLKRKFDVEFREGEVDYYISNLRLNKIQKDLIFQFYASYFGGLRDSYDAPRKQLAKLIIIMKEIMKIYGFDYMQHILTANLRYNPNMKKLPKKIIQDIERSQRYKNLEEKYAGTFELIKHKIFEDINIILNSRIEVVDFDYRDEEGLSINPKQHQLNIIDEYLKLCEKI